MYNIRNLADAIADLEHGQSPMDVQHNCQQVLDILEHIQFEVEELEAKAMETQDMLEELLGDAYNLASDISGVY